MFIIRTWRGVHYGSYEKLVKTLLGLDEQVVLSGGRPRNADVSAVDRERAVRSAFLHSK